MKITRDVITDILPVYFSGEASTDTKALVEAFLKQDPEFTKLIKANDVVLLASQKIFSKETNMDKQEMQTLIKTVNLLRTRSIYLALTILFFLMPLSFKFDSQGFHWIWADAPINAVIFLLLGCVFGLLYWRIAGKLRETGL